MKKIRIFMVVVLSVVLVFGSVSAVPNNDIPQEGVVYISSNGSDSNDGTTQENPIKTFDAVNSRLSEINEIIVIDSATYKDFNQTFPHEIKISGLTGNETLALPAAISIKGDTVIDKIKLSGASTIYANGHKLEIGEGVTSADRLNVYGGASGIPCDSTDVRLYGGIYATVYGGGNGGAVKGNTNVVIGGKVNPNDGIDDAASNISPTMIYGGGNNAAVNGCTNITLTGNASVKYLVGAGTGSLGTTPETYINIQGGKVMNVYAGAQGTMLNGTNTHIIMTGGTAEALFGGSESSDMTGNTYLTLKGGQVTRRVYTGCYNDFDIGFSNILSGGTWKSDRYVKGTTTLAIYPEMKLNTKDGLSADNSVNVGVFSGSRTKASHSDEKNIIIYLDGCYNSQKSAIGEKSKKSMVSLSLWLKSFANYSVNAGHGGKVLGTGVGGQIMLVPDAGKVAVVNGSTFLENQTVTLSASTTEVNFNGISTAQISRTDSGALVNVNISGVSGKLFAAVFDENESIVSCEAADVTADTDEYEIELKGELVADKTYTAKLYMLESFTKVVPLICEYSCEI